MAVEKTLALGALLWIAATSMAAAGELDNSIFSSGWDANGNKFVRNLGGLTNVTTTTTTTNSDGSRTVNSSTIGPATNPTPGGPPGNAAQADAFLNFGNADYAEAKSLTTGNPQGWFTSPVVKNFYGGVPNAQQRQEFTDAVVRDVTRAYKLSGLDIKLTTDPNVNAAHALAVVSGASSTAVPNAIGITDVGNSGFSFIDKFGSATSIDQLQWAIAHNITHELMHAFGVAAHDDQTGAYLDSAITPWSLLLDPNARLSPQAVDDLSNLNWRTNGSGSNTYGAELMGPVNPDGDRQIAPSPVPEPTTLAFWGLAATALTLRVRRRRGQSS